MLRVTPVPGPGGAPLHRRRLERADIDAASVRWPAGASEFTRYDGMTQDDLGIWTTPGGDRVAWFSDPDGNTLSLTAFAAP